MIGARINTLASLRGRIERIEAPNAALSEAYAPNKIALGHAEADAALRGGLAAAAVHEVFAEGHQSAAATGFIAGLAGRVTARRPLVWVRQDFSEIESGALSARGLTELGLDPRALVTVRAADVDARATDHCGRAGLRCARRRGAGSLGAATPARSGREPQAHAGRASVRRHRAAVASRGAAIAFDRGDPMDRARGAFAACGALACVGRAGVRRRTRS